MNFLNSAFLAGLAAAIVPLLIHLLNRRKVKRVDFSSVMFLRDLRKSRMRRLELRRWLLLAIRTLMVAFVVLAFARPALQSDALSGLGAAARTTAVVGLDLSASMALETANGTAQDRARRRVNEIAELLSDGDELVALPFTEVSNPLTDQPTAAIGPLIARLNAMETTYGSTDVTAALNAAVGALGKSQSMNREVYLVTDRRRTGYVKATLDSAAREHADLPVYLVDVSENDDVIDLGVSQVALTDKLVEPNSPFTVTATILNHTDRPVEKLLASLFIDGRRVAQVEASLGPLGTATVTLGGLIDQPGIHAGFVEISPDDNPRDNRRHFALTIPDQIKILLASDYPSGRRAMAMALQPQQAMQTRTMIEEVDTPELVRRNLFDYDAVLITDWRQPDRLTVEQIIRYVRTGGGVLVVPSIDADSSAWNSLIATPHFGLRLGPAPNDPEPDRYFVWDRIDWNHPIWSVYRDVPSERIPEIRWYSIYRTEGSPTGGAIVDYSGGRPALSETRFDAGKLLVLWSPINTPYTDLPLRSLFVPFVNRTVEYLAADLSERRSEFRVGERAVREPAKSIPPSATVEVVRPDGTVARPGLETAGTRTRISYEGTDLPGVYSITAGGRPIDAFAVNLDPEETDAHLISNEELQRRWPGMKITVIDGADPLKKIVTESRFGTEIRPAFLWAVVALFFLEMYLARTRRRDLVAESGEAAVPAPEGARLRPVE